MRKTLPLLCRIATLAAAAIGCLLPTSAHASLAKCNDLSLLASSRCEVRVAGGCKTWCEPLRFVTYCTTKRYSVCRNECKLQLPDVSCTGSCKAGCTGGCTATPGTFDCQANCHGSCKSNCDANCTTTSNATKCKASCEASCTAECDARCNVTPPTASCDARCEASCNGSCQFTAPYLDCQVKCQEVQIPDCETTVKGGCETQCEAPDGALFCDGQYVNVQDQIRDCINDLNAFLKNGVDVSASATLTVDCSSGRCKLKVGNSVAVGCGVAPGSAPLHGTGLPFLAFACLAALVLVAAAKRR